MKALRTLLITGLFVGIAATAFAYTVGTPPTQGPQLVDGTWVSGLAQGYNRTYQSGITALGSTQATAQQLNAGVYLIEVDTVAGSTGVALPPCLAGTSLKIYNGSGTTLTIYPAVANNPITAAQDTINATTSKSLATHVVTTLSCAKDGIWSAS